MSTTPFFSLDAQYHVAPDAGFDALMNDADLLQDCAACIVQLVAASPEALATMYMESVLFGANFLIRMAVGITEAARRRAPKPEPASLQQVPVMPYTRRSTHWKGAGPGCTMRNASATTRLSGPFAKCWR